MNQISTSALKREISAGSLAVILGLMVGALYLFWRWDLGIVWDDSSTASLHAYGLRDSAIPLADVLRESFGTVQGGGYRPISAVIARLGAAWTANPDHIPWPFYLLNATILGGLAAAHFLLSHRFLRSTRWALAASFLYLCSTPILTGALVVFAGIQACVPLCLSVALLCYSALVDSRPGALVIGVTASELHPDMSPRRCNWISWGALTLVFTLGPWIREFIGLASLLIIGLELHRKRGCSRLTALSILGFTHALFPTALLHFLAFSELPLAPVHRLGSLGQIVKPLPDHISPGTVIRAVQALHWRIFLDLFSILPATAVAVGLTGLAIAAWCGRFRRKIVCGSASSVVYPIPSTGYSVLGFQSAAIITQNQKRSTEYSLPSTASQRTRVRTSDTDCRSEFARLMPFKTVGVPFLLMFFLVTFLPFLKVFKIQVHLAYSVVPFTILLAVGLREAWSRSGRGRWLLTALMILPCCDHALNPWVVHETTRTIYASVRKQADWFKREMPSGTPVLCNALQIEDIRYYSRGHIAVRSLAGGTPNPNDWIPDVAAANLLLERAPQGSVLALDVRASVEDQQLSADRQHYIVCQNLVELEELGAPDVVQFRYPCLDPLKALLPTYVAAWTGPPDLEFDFYRGPEQTGLFGWREVSADYRLFRITGNQVSRWEPHPVLLGEESEINLVALGRRFYGIPACEGSMTLSRFENGGYSQQFSADSLQELRAMVRAEIAVKKSNALR